MTQKNKEEVVVSNKFEKIIDSCKFLNDQDVTNVVQAILNDHNLVLNPQIVINVSKVNKNEEKESAK